MVLVYLIQRTHFPKNHLFKQFPHCIVDDVIIIGKIYLIIEWFYPSIRFLTKKTAIIIFQNDGHTSILRQ